MEGSKEVPDSWYWFCNDSNEIIAKLSKNTTTNQQDHKSWVWFDETEKCRTSKSTWTSKDP